ncbi:MAG: hypothetical protein HUJ86_06615, partial [Synergistes sp.]|nr:hypothetical protein [Synergistes sp.]
MLILHTAFEEDYIYLWGECSFEEPPQVSEKDGRTFLPWGAGISELRSALKVCGVRSGRKSTPEDAWIVSLLLPSRGGIPIPSSPMLGDIPESDEPAVLSPFFVESTILSFDEFSKLVRVIRESGEKLPFPGIIFGSDLKFMCRAFEYAAVLVQRGNYIPDMAPRGDSFVSQWRPIILTKYHDEANTFAAAMPPVLCAFSAKKPLEEPKTRRSCALSLLETLTDMIVRSSQHGVSEKGRRVNAENPHEIWIRSLIWQKNPLEKWDSDMALLYPQIRSWSDSLQSVTAQPWRMFMRLEEPISDKESNW